MSSELSALIAALAATMVLFVPAAAAARPAEEVDDLQLLTIDVTGESISGPGYGEHVEVERTASGWRLTRSCWRRAVTLPAADCGCSGTREIPPSDLRRLLAVLATLKDGGAGAECCDHPYSKIERRSASRRPATVTVPSDVLQEKEMPDLCASRSPDRDGR